MPFSFEHAQVGDAGTLPGAVVSAKDIVTFAERYDPQDFHIDSDMARASFVGELIASGWHTCALAMRAIADGLLAGSTGLGAPGIEEVQWLRPVRPGDTLSVRYEVLEKKISRSRPGMGLVRFRFDTINQHGETAMMQTNWIMFGLADTTEPA